MPNEPKDEHPVHTEHTEPPSPTPAGSGLESNVAGALSYLLGALTGVLFLVIDKDRPFVRFHAMQSIVFTVAWIGVWIALFVVGIVLGAIPVLGWIVDLFLSLAVAVIGFVLWVYLMYRAFQGHEWEIPFIGPQARKFAAEAREGGHI